MLSALSKAYIAFALLGAGGALVYIFGTGGDHMGGALLVTLAVAGLAFATATSLRSVVDTDLEVPVPADAPAPVRHAVAAPGPAVNPSVFPFAIAAGLTVVGVGATTSAVVVVAGFGLVAAGGLGWLSQSWRDHPLWTERFGARVGQRAVGPFTYPLLSVLLGAAVAFSISRLYLAVAENAAVVVSVVIAAVVLAGAVVLALGKDVRRRLTAVLSGVALLSVVGSGVAGYAVGQRDIETHPSDVHDVVVEAQGIAYKQTVLDVPAGKVRLTFVNHDPTGTIHDVGVYSLPPAGTPATTFVAGDPFVAVLPIDGGHKGKALVDTGVVGLEVGRSYLFRCDFHPAMRGTLTIVPAPAHAEKDGHQ